MNLLRLIALTSLISLSTQAQSPPDCDPLTNGMVGWWKLEQNGLDSSGAGNHGQLLEQAAFANGVAGSGFYGPGTDIPAALKIPANATLDVGKADGFTLEAWINPQSLDRRQPIFEWNNSHTNDVVTWGVHFLILEPQEFGLGSGNLFANIWGSNPAGDHLISARGGTVTSGGFQHVALTFRHSDGRARLYRNGEKVAESTFGPFTPETSFDLFIGRRPAGDQSPLFSFHGGIDEPAVFNRELEEREVRAIYNAGANGHCVRIPPEVSIRLSQVEICWSTRATRSYQVEYRPAASSDGAWLPLGAIIPGNGATNCVTDAITPGQAHRLYRIQEL